VTLHSRINWSFERENSFIIGSSSFWGIVSKVRPAGSVILPSLTVVIFVAPKLTCVDAIFGKVSDNGKQDATLRNERLLIIMVVSQAKYILYLEYVS
jgi:hypothetical protein